MVDSEEWQLQGGASGVWMRRGLRSDQYVICFSPSSHQLLWLPACCCPGIAASRMNVAALYAEALPQKLSWFYTQVWVHPGL